MFPGKSIPRCSQETDKLPTVTAFACFIEQVVEVPLFATNLGRKNPSDHRPGGQSNGPGKAADSHGRSFVMKRQRVIRKNGHLSRPTVTMGSP
jgi:hypothetical protein